MCVVNRIVLASCAFLASCLVASAKPVARIGNVEYETLREAIKATGNIILLRDVVDDRPYPSIWFYPQPEITLDLAGHSLIGTNEQYSVVENGYTVLTIKDSVGGGKITRTVPKKGDPGAGIVNRATLTLKGVHIVDCHHLDGQGGAISNIGKMIVDDVLIENCSANVGGAIANNGAVNNVPCETIFNGGVVKDCRSTSDGGAIYNGCFFTINNGLFSNCYSEKSVAGLYGMSSGRGVITINGGRFENCALAGSSIRFNISGGLYDEASVSASPNFRAYIDAKSELRENEDAKTKETYKWLVYTEPPPPPPVKPFVFIIK